MDVIAALQEQQAELADVLARLTDDDWARPSACEGWSVSDVVLHLAQTDELALASVEGRFSERLATLASGGDAAGSVDDGAAILVAQERGEPGRAVRARWQASADDLREALAAADPHSRVRWVGGQLSVRTLTTTRLAETWIHSGDVAEGVGVELVPTDRLWHIARLAWRTLPYAFARAGADLSGPVTFDLVLPSGEPAVFAEGRSETAIRGRADELCLVAARRRDPADTDLVGEGPDAAAVLQLVRTYA